MDLSPGVLFASLVVSTIGFGLFVYGKKAQRWPQLVAGCALLVFPYFVASALWVVVIGAALLGALVLAVRAGL